MNELVRRGFNAYKIFMKNKLAMAFMMFFSGAMMMFAAFGGKGNDTKSIPIMITIAGGVLALWAFFRLGFLKSNSSNLKTPEEIQAYKKQFIFQIIEASIYVVILVVGIILLLNEQFVNKMLNIMTGSFTILNAVTSSIYLYKKSKLKNLVWKIRMVLVLVEFVIGPFFIIASDSIDIGWYIVMGIITTVAGFFEVLAAFSAKALVGAVEDGKDMFRALTNDKSQHIRPEEEEEDISLDEGDED